MLKYIPAFRIMNQCEKAVKNRSQLVAVLLKVDRNVVEICRLKASVNKTFELTRQ